MSRSLSLYPVLRIYYSREKAIMGDTAVVTGSIVTSESGFLRGHGTYVDHIKDEDNPNEQKQRVSEHD